MGATTSIEWTDTTWSPLRVRVKQDAGAIAEANGYTSLVQIATKMAGHVGPHCERVSHGCDHCYSDTNNGRCLPSNGTGLPFDRRSRDLVDPFVDEKILMQPLHWKRGRKIFVENQSDLFGEWNTDEMIDYVWAVMLLCPQHQFQILSKRANRMFKHFRNQADLRDRIAAIITDPRFLDNWGDQRKLVLGNPSRAAVAEGIRKGWRSPLPEWIWLGISCEDQKTADERIPLLLQTPASVRFVSYEPAQGPVNFETLGLCRDYRYGTPQALPGIDWIIIGAESGPGARPFNEDWARSTRDQCVVAGKAFFYKQNATKGHKIPTPELDGRKWTQFPEVSHV